MQKGWYLLGVLVLLSLYTQTASAQFPINVNQTKPCFLNYSAGWHVLENCGAKVDFLQFSILPWEWITGGYFSVIIVTILILFTWIKYQKIAYPMMVGVMFLPVSYFLFPDIFLSFSFVMFGLGCCILVWYAFIKQSKEY